MYRSKSRTALALGSMLFSRSRCIFAVACTAYRIVTPKTPTRTPVPCTAFGPQHMNMFGKPSTHNERYDVACGFHFSFRLCPFRPTTSNGSCHDVSYPACAES